MKHAPAPAITLENITKSFLSNTVLKNISFAVNAGEIHALVGENGAGKSTLMNILAGVHRPDSGNIWLKEEIIEHHSPKKAIQHGINFIHQELNIAHNLTVAENVFMGRELYSGFLLKKKEMEARTQTVLDELGAKFSPNTLTSSLSVADKQQVEVARSLVYDCKVLIMDEPTAALSDNEIERLFEVMHFLKREKQVGIIYISHRLKELDGVADKVTVLRDGECIGTLHKDEMKQDTIVQMMVGRPLSNFYIKEPAQVLHKDDSHILRVEHLSDGVRVKDVSFLAYPGEILGIAGLVGAGRTEMARLIFAADTKTKGEIYLKGKKITAQNPIAAIKQGIAYIPEDRKTQGLFLDMTCRRNIVLNVLKHCLMGGVYIVKKKSKEISAHSIKEYNIKLSHEDAAARTLSGGNQQKLLISRWIESKPDVLILDEPTQGVDVGAKKEIYRIMSALAKTGAIVIVISSELPEIIGIAHRVLVMHGGHISGEITREEDMTQEQIMEYATGLRTNYVY